MQTILNTLTLKQVTRRILGLRPRSPTPESDDVPLVNFDEDFMTTLGMPRDLCEKIGEVTRASDLLHAGLRYAVTPYHDCVAVWSLGNGPDGLIPVMVEAIFSPPNLEDVPCAIGRLYQLVLSHVIAYVTCKRRALNQDKYIKIFNTVDDVIKQYGMFPHSRVDAGVLTDSIYSTTPIFFEYEEILLFGSMKVELGDHNLVFQSVLDNEDHDD